MVDFRTQAPTESLKKKEKVVIRGGGQRRDQSRPSNSREFEKDSRREKFEAKKRSFIPKGRCFVCKRPYPMKECPKLGTLLAIVEQHEAEADEAKICNMGVVATP